MLYPTENKIFDLTKQKGKNLILVPNDYLLDKSISGQEVMILKREAIEKISDFFDLEFLPYEKGHTTVLPNTIPYNNVLIPSIVEHAFVKGLVKPDKEIVVEGVGEANALTVSKDFTGYIGTMARKRATTNAVIRFFIKYLVANDMDTSVLNIYSQEEWKNAKNDFTIINLVSPSKEEKTEIKTETLSDVHTKKEEPTKEVGYTEAMNSTTGTTDSNVTNADATNVPYTFTAGKYKNKTVDEVYDIDKGYLEWLINKQTNNPSYKDAVDAATKCFKNKK